MALLYLFHLMSAPAASIRGMTQNVELQDFMLL
jgi:hypothetical protein